MAITIYTFARAFFRLDKRCLLGACLFMILNANLLVLMYFRDDQIDSRNAMNMLFPSSPLESNDFESHNFAHRTDFVNLLPSFTEDRREIILAAIIERSSTSPHLSMTVFVLNRNILIRDCKGSCPSRLNEKAEAMWSGLRTAPEYDYSYGGKRLGFDIYCKISNSEGLTPYVVPATFVANNHSSELSANGRIDIFRCPMKNTLHAFDSLVQSDKSVYVSLLQMRKGRGILNGGITMVSLLNFTVPWSLRRVGYMLNEFHPEASTSPDKDIPTPLTLSLFDGWTGYISQDDHLSAKLSRSAHNVSSTGDAAYLCVTLSVDSLFAPMAGAAAAPSVGNVAQLLEFIVHHLMLGIRHIFLAVRYAPGSANMRTLLLSLREFIEAGQVTVSSQSGDGIDRTASLFGLAFSAEFLSLYHRTVILFLLKGTQYSTTHGRGLGNNYLAMWGLDSMFVPSDVRTLAPDAFRTALSIDSSTTGLRGQGRDVQCHVILSSVKIVERFPGRVIDCTKPWLKDRFPVGDSFFLTPLISKSDKLQSSHEILTSLSTQQDVGLVVEVDRVLQPAVPSSEVRHSCAKHRQPSYKGHSDSLEGWFPSSYGNMILDGENSGLMEDSEGPAMNAVLYRYLVKTFRYDKDSYLPQITSPSTREYVSLFSESVMKKLHEKNLDVMVLVMLLEQSVLKGVEEEHWPKYGPLSLLY